MKSARWIRFTLAALMAASPTVFGAASRSRTPEPSDLKVVTRTTYGQHGVTETRTLYVKGARLRSDAISRTHDGESRLERTRIMRCDERRMLLLNPEARTYAFMPVPDIPATTAAVVRARAALAQPVPRGADVEITIDAVDTGERRAIGSYEARHVITTRKTEPSPGAQTPRSTTVTDGWYVDVPEFDCATRRDSSAVAVEFVIWQGGDPPDAIHVKRLRTARTGYAIEETERQTGAGGTFVSETELIEASAAPLASTLFDVPGGYRRALPRIDGGVDLSRPDTFVARLTSYCEFVADWVRWLSHHIR